MKQSLVPFPAPVWSVGVAGTTHFNFTEFSLISPLFRRLGLLGSIDGMRMEKS